MALTPTPIFYYQFFSSNSSLPFNSSPIPCFSYYFYFSFISRLLTLSSFLLFVLFTLILRSFPLSSSLINLTLMLMLLLTLLISLLPPIMLLTLIIFIRFLPAVIIN